MWPPPHPTATIATSKKASPGAFRFIRPPSKSLERKVTRRARPNRDATPSVNASTVLGDRALRAIPAPPLEGDVVVARGGAAAAHVLVGGATLSARAAAARASAAPTATATAAATPAQEDDAVRDDVRGV